MPTHGQFRYQVGEPYYYYDVRAEVNHNGEYKEIVLVDENVELKNKRPFLILIWDAFWLDFTTYLVLLFLGLILFL